MRDKNKVPDRKTLDEWFEKALDNEASRKEVTERLRARYKKKLEKALKKEDYIKCAEYRDIINQLEIELLII